MKARITLLISGLILLAVASIARLANSNFLEGSASDIALTLGLAAIGLVIIGFFAVKSVKAKLKYVQEVRAEYQAAYMCMIQADPINTYILAATDTELKLLTNDKKKELILELKKDYITMEIADVMLRGIRKNKGLRISTNTAVAEATNGENISTEIVLLDDTKLLTPPLKEDALNTALLKLS